MKRLILAVLVFVFLFSAFAVQAPVQAAPAKSTGLTGMVLASQLFVRNSPRLGENVLSAINWGETVQILGRNPAANWFKVVTEDGTVGWVSAFWVRMSRNVSRASLPIVQ